MKNNEGIFIFDSKIFFKSEKAKGFDAIFILSGENQRMMVVILREVFIVK